jgi:chitinase
VAQLQNKSFAFIDGLHTFCGGVGFLQDPASGAWTVAVHNASAYAECLPIKAALNALGKEYHVCLGRVPTEMKPSDEPALLKSMVAVAQQHGIDGFNIDDESECAPRADLTNFTKWVELTSKMADALHAATPKRIQLTADIQA